MNPPAGQDLNDLETEFDRQLLEQRQLETFPEPLTLFSVFQGFVLGLP